MTGWRRRGTPAAVAAALPRTGIELRGVSHSFGDRPVLRDLTLTLAERRIGVIGGNGSGKSTLARLLNGLVLPTEGRVLVDGLDTRTELRAVRRRVGFVFQDPDAQIVHPTVAEDVAFGLQNQGVPAGERAVRVAEVLDRYGLAGHADQRPRRHEHGRHRERQHRQPGQREQLEPGRRAVHRAGPRDVQREGHRSAISFR